MPTGFTTITAAKIQNASGKPLAAGRVKFFPVSSPTGGPISALAGGGGLITQEGVTFLVVNGAITTDIYGSTAQVADTALTTPANIAYRVTVWDDDLGAQVQGPGYGSVQPSGSTWSLDSYVPVQPLQLIVQAGPPGSPGVAPTFAVGTVTTLAAGSAATAAVDASSTISHVVLNFGIPAGAAGAAGSISGGVSSITLIDTVTGANVTFESQNGVLTTVGP